MDLDKASNYSSIGTFILTAAIFILTAILVWPLVRPEAAESSSAPQGGVAMTAISLFALAALFVLVAAVLNIAATRNKRDKSTNPALLGIDPETHKKTIEKLTTCESEVRHWKDEVRRVGVSYASEKETLEKLWKESEGKANNLEQKLRVTQNKLDEFKTPRGRLKITKATYWIEHPETKEIKEVDVTAVLDSLILDDTLSLNKLYQLIFPEPLKHVKKKLTVDYLHGGRQFSVTVPESTKLVLPFPYDDIPFNG